ELHGVAQCFEAVDQATGDVLFVALVEIVRSEIGVIHRVAQEVIGDDQDGVADGDDGLLLAAAGDEAVVQRSEIGLSRSAAGVCGLDKRGAEPGVAFARLARFAFASTLVVTRTHTRPRPTLSRTFSTNCGSVDNLKV